MNGNFHRRFWLSRVQSDTLWATEICHNRCKTLSKKKKKITNQLYPRPWNCSVIIIDNTVFSF